MTGVGGQAGAQPRELVGHFKGDTPHKYSFNTLLFGSISKEALFYFHTLHNSRFPVPRCRGALLSAQRPFKKPQKALSSSPNRDCFVHRSEH